MELNLGSKFDVDKRITRFVLTGATDRLKHKSLQNRM